VISSPIAADSYPDTSAWSFILIASRFGAQVENNV